MLRLEFDGEEWTSSFPNEAQPSVSHCIESQSASTVERNDTAAAATSISRPRFYVGVMVSQSLLPPLSDQPRYQPEPLAHPDQNSVSAITLDDGQVPRPLNHENSGLDRGTRVMFPISTNQAWKAIRVGRVQRAKASPTLVTMTT